MCNTTSPTLPCPQHALNALNAATVLRDHTRRLLMTIGPDLRDEAAARAAAAHCAWDDAAAWYAATPEGAVDLTERKSDAEWVEATTLDTLEKVTAAADVSAYLTALQRGAVLRLVATATHERLTHTPSVLQVATERN